MTQSEVATSLRFDHLWSAWDGIKGGAIETEEEPASYGSLIYDRKRIRAAGVAGEVLFVNSGEVVFGNNDPDLYQRLTFLERLAELHPRFRVSPETLKGIEGLTDRALEEMGFPIDETTPTPVVEFIVKKPNQPRRKLQVYSIAAGTGGYNTFTEPLRPQDDNSRRWHICHDGPSQHRDFRADPSIGNIGTIYEHGSYEPHQEVIAWHDPQRDTSIVDGIIADFYYNNPDGIVTASLHRKIGEWPGVEFGPVPIHHSVEV